MNGVFDALWGVPNHDVAWYLDVARRVLNGERLYSDLIEINPPLIIWLKLPIVWAAELLGIQDVQAYRAAVLALIAAVLWANNRLTQPLLSRHERIAAAVALAVTLAIMPGYDFGQREHLAVIVLTPWVALVARHRMGLATAAGVAVSVGLLGSIGILLKPHLALVWVALWIASGLRIRIEDITLGAMAALYAAAVIIITPQYLGVVKLLAPLYGRLYSMPLVGVALRVQVFLLILGLLLYALSRGRTARDGLMAGWVAVGCGALASAVLQGKGFPYHLYPVGAAGVMLVFLAALEPASAGLPRWVSPRPARVVLLLIAVVLMVGGPTRLGSGHPYQPARQLIPLIRQHAAGKAILVLSPSVRDGFPIVNESGAQWAMAFPMPWVPYALVRPPRSPDTMGEAEAYAFDRVVSDFVRKRPRLLIVESNRPGGPRDIRGWFDFLSYYRQDPRFDTAFRHYRQLASIGVFDVYERGDSVP